MRTLEKKCDYATESAPEALLRKKALRTQCDELRSKGEYILWNLKSFARKHQKERWKRKKGRPYPLDPWRCEKAAADGRHPDQDAVGVPLRKEKKARDHKNNGSGSVQEGAAGVRKVSSEVQNYLYDEGSMDCTRRP